MALSINIDGNRYEIEGVDHPAEQEALLSLVKAVEKYAKEDKDLQTKMLKELEDGFKQLGKDFKDAAADTKKAAATAAAAPNQQTTQAATQTTRAANNINQAFNRAAADARTQTKVMGNLTQNAGFASNAVQSMASGLQETSGILPVLGSALGGIIKTAGFVASALISVGSAALSSFMDASRFQGELAKGGARFTGSLLELNNTAGAAGMTMTQLTGVIMNNRDALSQLGRGAQDGARRFTQLIISARNSSASLAGLGFSAEEEASARADYIQILKEQGGSEQLRTMSNGQIIAQSNKMIKGFLGVAAATGTTVSELMKKAKEIAGSPDVLLTLEGLAMTNKQREQAAANLAILEANGLGALKDVFLEVKTFGTGIGDTANTLKMFGGDMAPALERFLGNLENMNPEQVQVEMIRLAKSLPTQQISQLAGAAQEMSGPAGQVAAKLVQLARMSDKDIEAQQAQAKQQSANLAAARRFEDTMNQLKARLNGVLLQIAQSDSFQQALSSFVGLVEKYGPKFSEIMGKVIDAVDVFIQDLQSDEGRDRIINRIGNFMEMIGKEILSRINLGLVAAIGAGALAVSVAFGAAKALIIGGIERAVLGKGAGAGAGAGASGGLLDRIFKRTPTAPQLPTAAPAAPAPLDRTARNWARSEASIAGSKAQMSYMKTAGEDYVSGRMSKEDWDAGRKQAARQARRDYFNNLRQERAAGVDRFNVPGTATPAMPNPAKQAAGANILNQTTSAGPTAGATLESIAKGLSAFNPAAAKGAFFLGVSLAAIITGAGAGIAAAMYLMGKALPTFSKGLESLNDIDGGNLVKVGLGIGAFAAGLAAMGVGAAVGGVGALIGTITQGLSKMFGGEDVMAQLTRFSQYDIDAAKVKNNAEAVIAFSQAMAVSGLSKALGGIGNIVGSIANGLVSFFTGQKGPIPWDELKKFGSIDLPAARIKANAEAVAAWATAMGDMPSNVGMRSGGVWGWMKDLLLGDDTKDFPWDSLRSFGEDKGIDSEGVKKNAEAVKLFAEAVNEMPDVQARAGGVWGWMKDIWAGEASAINWQQMVDFGNIDMPVEGIRKNTEAVKIFAEAIEAMPEVKNVRQGGVWNAIKSFFVGDETAARPWKILEEFGAVALPLESIKNNSQAIAEFSKAMELMPSSAGGSAFFEGLVKAHKAGVFTEDSLAGIDAAIVKFDRLKGSMSFVTQAANGEFVLKPIDIALYEQLNQSLEQTKERINTTFSRKTYEETFKSTTARIDATYNVKTSKLEDTLKETAAAIKKALSPPWQALSDLTDAIVNAVRTATAAISSPDGTVSSGDFQIDQFLSRTKELESAGGRDLRPIGFTGAGSIAGKYHMGDAERQTAYKSLSAADRAKVDAAMRGAGFRAGAPSSNQLLKDSKTFNQGMGEVDDILAQAHARNLEAELTRRLGRKPTMADMRGAWWMGVGGYMKLLNADPNATVASLYAGTKTDVSQFKGRTVAEQRAYINKTMGGYGDITMAGRTTDLSPANTGSLTTVRSDYSQLRWDPNKKAFVDSRGEIKKDGTITAVSNEANTDEKILNLLEQTYNLHADAYSKGDKARRFKGFTEI